MNSLQNKRRGTREAGYTIVEMIVAVAIFALAFLAIGAIFIGYTNAQGRASTAQRLLNEGNFTLEAVTREIRMNTIDYNCGLRSTTYVCLLGADGRAIHFRYNDPSAPGKLQACREFDASPCLDALDWISLHDDALRILSASFQLFPESNPLAIDADSDELFHPIMTILMTVEAGSGRSLQQFDLQTAVSSRVYNF